MKYGFLIGEKMDENLIKSTSKEEYKIQIKEKVKQAAFEQYIKMKESHSKLNEVKYTSLEIQPYLKSEMFNKEEMKLLYLLRSRCHKSKNNFRKMFKNNVQCLFGCNESESQIHVFIHCFPVISQTTASNIILNYDDIFGSIHHQKQVIKIST